MKKWIGIGMILFTLILMLAACNEEDEGAEVASSTAEAEENTDDAETAEGDVDRSDWPETVKYAAAGIEGIEELTRRFDEFSALLEDLMGVEFEMFSLSDRTVSSTALEYGQVDMVLSGPSEYILSKIANPDIALVGGLERENYYTVFITHADSGIETLDD